MKRGYIDPFGDRCFFSALASQPADYPKSVFLSFPYPSDIRPNDWRFVDEDVFTSDNYLLQDFSEGFLPIHTFVTIIGTIAYIAHILSFVGQNMGSLIACSNRY